MRREYPSMKLPGVWHLLLRSKPAETPAAVWTHLTQTDRRAARRMTVGAAMFVGGLLLLIGATISDVPGARSDLIVKLQLIGWFSVMFAAIPVVRGQRRAVRSFREFLNEHHSLICFDCGYILKGFDDDPLVCPECGRRAGRLEVQERWRRRLVGFWYKEPIGPGVGI